MNEKNSLSIAIPTYNGDKLLKKQFQILFDDCNNKKFLNFYEIIIVDNCSTDSTKEIVKNFIKRNKSHKIFKIKYVRRRKNIGFRKNFLSLKKFINNKYVLFLNDDNLPSKGFYKKLYGVLRNSEYKEMLILPISNSNKYYSAFFGINNVSYVINRGSILSGIIIQNKFFKYKNYLKNLYPQTELYLDYYLKHGMRQINIKPVISNLGNKSISKRINSGDRMKRKSDFAILGKIEIIDKFYKNKKISIFQFFYAFYSIYKKAIHIKKTLNDEKKFSLENNFYKEIINYKRRKLVKFTIFLVRLRNLF